MCCHIVTDKSTNTLSQTIGFRSCHTTFHQNIWFSTDQFDSLSGDFLRKIDFVNGS